MKYIQIKESDLNTYQYTFIKYYKGSNIIYYYCSDTYCKARIYISLEERPNENNNINTSHNINFSYNHSLEYYLHNYYSNKNIKKDMEISSATTIVKNVQIIVINVIF